MPEEQVAKSDFFWYTNRMDLLNLIVLVGVLLLIPTAYAAKIGAPYVPTFTRTIKQAFDFINLNSTDTLVDLGAGDGKVVLLAARRGATAKGYELSPIMWLIAWLRTLFIPHARVVYGNFYKQQLAEATVVFVFLMPQNMERLRRYLSQQAIPNGKYLLSYTFPFKSALPLKTIRVPKCGPLYIYDLRKLTQS